MRLLRTYLLREHSGPFFVTMGGLTAVLLVGNLVKFAELVIAKGVSLFDIVRLIIYLIPFMLTFTIPMACLIAMILAFGRLSSDYELIAMRASGVAPARLVSPMLIVGLIFSVLLVAVNDRLVPASRLAFRKQLKAIGVQQPTAYLESGIFIKDFPPYVIFVYGVEGQRLNNVRIYEPQPNGPTRTIIADRGVFERLPNRRGVQLKLSDGTVDEWDPMHPGAFTKAVFSTYTMALQTTTEDPDRIGKKIKELTLKELTAERRRLIAESIDPLPVSLELHRRIAGPFAVLVFILFGLALGLRLHHHERLVGYAWVLGIFMSYYLATIGMSAVALKDWVPAWAAMWTPNLLGTAISLPMMLRAIRR
ncbi:MAG: LptF/LptG family permease [Candidatus Omnitrophica bacterium]|nr:LptF/LptG family permease [Candidatus Omnitrophota bacterium]